MIVYEQEQRLLESNNTKTKTKIDYYTINLVDRKKAFKRNLVFIYSSAITQIASITDIIDLTLSNHDITMCLLNVQ